MTASKKLTPAMREAVSNAEGNGGTLHRYPGGFWSWPNASWSGSTPSGWFCGTSTVEALVDRGRLVYTRWQDGRSGRFPVHATIPELAAAVLAAAPPPAHEPLAERVAHDAEAFESLVLAL